jgi:hypothetical protein
MLGDGDYYDAFTMGPFPKDKIEYLEEVVSLLEKMSKKRNSEDYDDMEGFQFWFNECNIQNYDEEDPKVKFYSDIKFKSETTSSCYGWKSYEGYNYVLQTYEVFYINADGSKSEVKVTY